jgi:two-component sensor histidine kinase
MVTALGLYCDLLEEPGVLAAPFTHYGTELRLVAAASRRLVEKLVALDSNIASTIDSGSKVEVHPRFNTSVYTHVDPNAVPTFSNLPDVWPDRSLGSRSSSPLNTSPNTTAVERAVSRSMERVGGNSHAAVAPVRWDMMPAVPIENMALEMLANHNLLAALAGPLIAVTVDVEGATKAVRLTGEDLTRVLVNLVKNAAEAMPNGGSIHIALGELPAVEGAAEGLRLTIEDSGPGIPATALESIFASGYTTRAQVTAGGASWAAAHRGLGLAITRSIVEAAGGRVLLTSQAPAGARFEIELPVRKARH